MIDDEENLECRRGPEPWWAGHWIFGHLCAATGWLRDLGSLKTKPKQLFQKKGSPTGDPLTADHVAMISPAIGTGSLTPLVHTSFISR